VRVTTIYTRNTANLLI